MRSATDRNSSEAVIVGNRPGGIVGTRALLDLDVELERCRGRGHRSPSDDGVVARTHSGALRVFEHRRYPGDPTFRRGPGNTPERVSSRPWDLPRPASGRSMPSSSRRRDDDTEEHGRPGRWCMLMDEGRQCFDSCPSSGAGLSGDCRSRGHESDGDEGLPSAAACRAVHAAADRDQPLQSGGGFPMVDIVRPTLALASSSPALSPHPPPLERGRPLASDPDADAGVDYVVVWPPASWWT